ncbi:MAG: isomerase [Gammaproteobacteria bacterium]|nr:isomerase [Gammaproteobacteria bacterium]MAY02834.1 isomerase [Gammaproteobacteria bacterium]|tara:strand:+ start:480 stop:1259 length:780 start_codon:yes stop_codon:yes gene_type:complete
MKLTLYQIDAFTDRVFSGNPAAVIPLDKWLDDKLMQSIAAENNLSETVFFVAEKDGFRIRWFTPTVEVNLCGHATLASAFVLFNELDYPDEEIIFYSKSDELRVSKDKDLLMLDFPVQKPEPCPLPEVLLEAIGVEPLACLRNIDFVLVYEREQTIGRIAPRHELIRESGARGVIVTAPGTEHDFVARFFASGTGIDEDPVTGSAYTELVPYWAERTGQRNFRARQMSKRGGELQLELRGDRVMIAGQAVKYLLGMIEV